MLGRVTVRPQQNISIPALAYEVGYMLINCVSRKSAHRLKVRCHVFVTCGVTIELIVKWQSLFLFIKIYFGHPSHSVSISQNLNQRLLLSTLLHKNEVVLAKKSMRRWQWQCHSCDDCLDFHSSTSESS